MEKAKRNERLARPYSSAERAAVIITVLGEAAARPIVEKLDNESLGKVVAALDQIQLLPRDDMATIVMDFLSHLRNTSRPLVEGRGAVNALIEMTLEARQPLQSFDGPLEVRALDNLVEDSAEIASEDVWEQVSAKDPEKIAAYLNTLTPNLISLIFRKLKVSVTSEIFGYLDEDKVQSVMSKLLHSDEVDDGLDQVIGRMVEMEFLRAEQAVDTDGGAHFEELGEMLSLMPVQRRDGLMAFLGTEHQEELASIQKSLFTVEALPELLPRNAIPVALRDIDAKDTLDLLAALSSSHSDVSEFLLSNISSRQAEQFRQDLEAHSGLGEAETERALRQFLSHLMTLKRKGTITVNARSESAEPQ